MPMRQNRTLKATVMMMMMMRWRMMMMKRMIAVHLAMSEEARESSPANTEVKENVHVRLLDWFK